MRKRRRSRTRKNHLDQKPVKIILVEGETEENYVNYLKSQYHLNYKLKIFKRSKIEKNIHNTINKLTVQHSVTEEELILLYDLENDSNEYSKFINGNTLKYKNTYLTQPCIEYHFLLHHEKSIASPKKYRTAKETEKELKKLLPNYIKGSSFIWSKSNIGIEEVSLAKKRSIETFCSYSQMSFSTVGQLIKKHFKD